MKNIVLFSTIILTSLFFSSCDDDSPTLDDVGGDMRYFVDGSIQNVGDPVAVVTSSGIKITGMTANKQTVVLYVNNPEIDSYILDENLGNFAEYHPNTATQNIYTTLTENGTGRVIIKGMNKEKKTLSGSFNFTAYRTNISGTRKVTDGTFSNVPYTYIERSYYCTYFYQRNFHEIANPDIEIHNDTITMTIDSGAYSIEINMPNGISQGTWLFSGENANVSAKIKIGSREYLANSGKLVISKNDVFIKKMEGAFDFSYLNDDSNLEKISAGKFAFLY
jgi:hypothetical protein